MKMKTKYFFMLMVACFLGTQVMNAQNEEQRRGRKRMTLEQITELQANKIVQELGLDDATAAKFTDVYKKYKKEMESVRKPNFGKRPDVKTGDKGQRPVSTDAEVEKRIKENFAQSRKMIDIREKYYDEFRKFLSPKQIQKIYDQGNSVRGKFHREMNRRAGMKPMDEGNRPPVNGRNRGK